MYIAKLILVVVFLAASGANVLKRKDYEDESLLVDTNVLDQGINIKYDPFDPQPTPSLLTRTERTHHTHRTHITRHTTKPTSPWTPTMTQMTSTPTNTPWSTTPSVYSTTTPTTTFPYSTITPIPPTPPPRPHMSLQRKRVIKVEDFETNPEPPPTTSYPFPITTTPGWNNKNLFTYLTPADLPLYPTTTPPGPPMRLSKKRVITVEDFNAYDESGVSSNA